MQEIFSKNNIPKKICNNFTHPKVTEYKLLVNNNGIEMKLCLTKCANCIVYRELNGIKTKIFDSVNVLNKDKIVYIDKDVKNNNVYYYYAVPYYTFNNKTYFGNEKFLGKIKYNCPELDNWWIDN